MKTVELLVDKFVLVSFGICRHYQAARVLSVSPKSLNGGRIVVEILEGKRAGKHVSRSYEADNIAHSDVFLTEGEALAESERRRK